MTELQQKHKDFVAAVAEMRRLQKEYFSKRDSRVLTAARKAEKEIDKFLKEEANPNNIQKKLF